MLTRLDKDQIAQAAYLFLAAGSVCEVRMLDVSTSDYRLPHVVSGYFDNVEALVAEVACVAPHAKGIYITLNPVVPALLARANNRLKPIRQREPLTSDRDIVERHFILIDIDPVRPAGISSTDREHQLAFDLALEIRSYLSEMGFPSPALADSGNGVHLLYRIQLPTEDSGLIKDLLNCLASKFDSAEVKIDTSVHNAGRITKLYGTPACKGDNMPERPHRLSRLLEVPVVLEPVSPDTIRSVVGAFQSQAHDSTPIKEVDTSQNFQAADGLKAWLLEKGLHLREPKIMPDGGVLFPVEVCPFNADHRGGSAYAGQRSNGARYFGCHHNSCQGKDWHALRDLLEPGWRSRKIASAKDATENSPQNAQGSEENHKSVSQATRIVDLVLEDATLFHSPEGHPYVALKVDGHQEVYSLRSRLMRGWCSRKFWETYHAAPGSQVIQDALAICTAISLEEECVPVFIRIGNVDKRLFLDLGTESWQAVEIDSNGWRLVERPQVMFRRPGTFGKLPVPKAGGNIFDLKRFMNLATEDDFSLLLAFLFGAFQCSGPFPLLNFIGEQGTAKSTSTKLLKKLIDPATSLVRNAPRSEHDLLLAAQNNHVMALDNLSRLQNWMSDALCRLSTGGGLGTRRLYSDDEELVLDAVKPVIVNGISDFIVRPDLLDRTILIELAPIPENKRRLEREYWNEFSELHPSLLGATLDQVSGILANLSNTRINSSPRMADFIAWSSSAEPTLGWETGAILKAYNRNRAQGEAVVLESSGLAQALLLYLNSLQQTGRFSWTGTASELFALIKPFSNPNDEEFPKTAHHLSSELRRLSPTLRQQHIELTFDERSGHNRDRLLKIEFSHFGEDAVLQENTK